MQRVLAVLHPPGRGWSNVNHRRRKVLTVLRVKFTTMTAHIIRLLAPPGLYKDSSQVASPDGLIATVIDGTLNIAHKFKS